MTAADFDEDAYLKRFHAEYLSPDDAAMPLDDDGEGGYFWTAPRVSSEDAVNELFSTELNEEQLAHLAASLNDSYGYWVRRADL